MKLMFICKANVFRSKISEAYFKKINKNKNIKLDSSGVFTGNVLGKNVFKIVKKSGITLRGKAKPLDDRLLKKQDLIIITADDVPVDLFNSKKYKKVIVWKIKDVKKANEKEVKRVIQEIKARVEKLVKRLENEK